MHQNNSYSVVDQKLLILQDPVLNADPDTQPNAVTVAFINTVVAFGRMIEVRTAFSQQNIPVFVRMLDKDSVWSWENGLPTLVTTVKVSNVQVQTSKNKDFDWLLAAAI